ncbi:MAG: prepilin-type N-terminal cleavage/methylation domain-containing protein [Desulfoplanes sp.]|nr:prepilin-type N-terminal cleavage/methylation domain-containing protein [Desulfoplanes sp.]MDD4649565.1 prepilin-type N-terminal cleavage/methylation domain-containing protein [Desulfoplanes sp.]
MITINTDNGFTLIEVLIAMMILTIGLLGFSSLQGTNAMGNLKSNIVSMSSLIADAELEKIVNNSYADCVDYNATTIVDTKTYEIYCSVNENATDNYKNIQLVIQCDGKNICSFDYIKIQNYE